MITAKEAREKLRENRERIGAKHLEKLEEKIESLIIDATAQGRNYIILDILHGKDVFVYDIIDKLRQNGYTCTIEYITVRKFDIADIEFNYSRHHCYRISW